MFAYHECCSGDDDSTYAEVKERSISSYLYVDVLFPKKFPKRSWNYAGFSASRVAFVIHDASLGLNISFTFHGEVYHEALGKK